MISGILTGPEQPERDFVAKLKSLGFKRLTGILEPRNGVLAKGDVWIGYVSTHAFIFDRGTGWQPFATVLQTIDPQPPCPACGK